MAYSEELNMFTVHHYSPVPFFHVYTCMCIYPDCDKMNDSQFMGSSVWHTDLYVYPTFKNRLLPSLLRRGALTMLGLSPDRTQY